MRLSVTPPVLPAYALNLTIAENRRLGSEVFSLVYASGPSAGRVPGMYGVGLLGGEGLLLLGLGE